MFRRLFSRLQSKPQLWVQDGWHQKFGMNDDPGKTGQGMSSEDLAAWTTPSRDVLLGLQGQRVL